MRKLISSIVIVAFLAVGAYLYFNNASNTEEHQANNQADNPKSDNHEREKPGTMLENIFDSAKEGKMPNNDLVVGETSADDVYDSWGDTDDKTDVEGITYLDYPDQSTTIGIKNDVVVDARSFQKDIKQIDLQTIKDFKGDPDDERHFKDDDDNQTILVYEMPNDYELKWVLPKPTEEENNPNVHHIALTSEESAEKTDKDETANKENEAGTEDGGDNEDSMNLDEKIGQMIFSGVNGTEMNDDTKNIIENDHVGGIILFGDNIESAGQTVDFLNDIKDANEKNPSPLLTGVDEEGGSVTRVPDDVTSLPTNQAIGELDDPDLSYDVGSVLGEQMKALGFNLDFAPVMDVNSNPDNPVIGDRSFGDDPDTVSKLGVQTMKGIQSKDIISVMKHFPGHGDTGVDSHLELPKVDKGRDDLRNLELIPFQKAIENGADVSLIAHILLPQIDADNPASMSQKVITDMLRDDLGFDGVVVTDDLTMEAITDNYDIGEAALQSVKAGGDLMLVAHDYDSVQKVFDTLKEAVENGELSEERIDESVERIQNLKDKYDVKDESIEEPDLQTINQEAEEILDQVSE